MKESAKFGLPPLRQYWREINRQERQAQDELRAKRKTRDKKRGKCGCDAYKFPHRPNGGRCRYPDPPAVRWQDAQAAEIAARVEKFTARWGEPTAEQMFDLTALTTKPYRPYRKRYAGIVRQIARKNGLHPIRDRALIASLMPRVVAQAKQIKREAPKVKYRNVKITRPKVTDGKISFDVQAEWQTAGPAM